MEHFEVFLYETNLKKKYLKWIVPGIRNSISNAISLESGISG